MSATYENSPGGPDKELLRVLLVEDDEDDYVIIRELLSEIEGLELEWVSSYEEALGAIGREEHDVCLLDYRLGGRSGLDLLRAASERGHKTPMILLTGQGDRELDLEAMQAGAADYLVKGQIDAPLLERSIRYAFAQALKVLSESERRFRALVHNGSDIVTVLDSQGNMRYQSPSIERVLGHDPGEMVGRIAFEYVHPEDVARIRQTFATNLNLPGVHEPVDMRVRHADGSWRHMEVIANNLLDEPSVGGIVLNSRDVTERKALEERLSYQAFHDALTGLPNRIMLMAGLEQALERAEQGSGEVAVLFVDLDNFKLVNDSLGHGAGDEALVEVARRLLECVGARGVAARFGGDEFVILLEDVEGEAEATEVARRIVGALEASFQLGNKEVFFSVSIGAVVGPAPGLQDAPGLLRAADVALHRAKVTEAGYAVFDSAMNVRALERLDLEADLRRAVDRGEFVLYYQPKVELATGRIIGAEALVRWHSPERGMVAPAKFIPVAEEMGLIHPIGGWVLHEACLQARRWQGHSASGSRPSVSVNLSTAQLKHPHLVSEVARVIEETGIDPGSLILEITESMLMEDAEGGVETLCGLKALGLRVAVDDFGTGYSSLAYLKRFPIDTLKIDRAFVDGLSREPGDTAIVRAIMALARALGLEVVAEGIETAEQMGMLQELGCDYGQGYYFARPLPNVEAGEFLAQTRLEVGA